MSIAQSQPYICTFTGVDEATSLPRLIGLSKRYPAAEWGFLFSPKHAGQNPKYPSVDFLKLTLIGLPRHVRVALHICGAGVSQLIDGQGVVCDLVDLVAARAGRVQLNFSARDIGEAFSLQGLRACIARYPRLRFITQNNGANAELWNSLRHLPNHSILIDVSIHAPSEANLGEVTPPPNEFYLPEGGGFNPTRTFDEAGGRGIEPSVWMSPFSGVQCGYAGGLGPDNLAVQLPKIFAAGGKTDHWLDMESKLRDTQDRFDLDKVQTVLRILAAATRLGHPKIYPVIHFRDRATAFAEAYKAHDLRADGVFLISHQGDDDELLSVACAIQIRHPSLPVGINFLSKKAGIAAEKVHHFGLKMLWCDDAGVDSKGVASEGYQVREQLLASDDRFAVFASVAFKYQAHDPNPALAAQNALQAGFIPTTSGSATGSAPDLEKIIAMSAATGGTLAVASGMTPDNVGAYAPYLSHIFVSTGISSDEYTIDPIKLQALITNSQQPPMLHAAASLG